jgi:hypothetical protein
MSIGALNMGIVQSFLPFVSPLQIPNCFAWYGDLVNTGVTRTTLSNGAYITRWDDLSGNNYHLKELTTNKVTYLTTGNYIRFTTANAAKMQTANNVAEINGQPATTVFTVYKATDTTYSYRLDIGTPTTQYRLYRGASGERLSYWDAGPTYNRWQPYEVAGGNYIQTTTHTASSNRTTEAVRVNGVAGTNYNNSGTNTPSITGKLGIGVYGIPNDDLREIIMYNRVLTATEIGLVESWLNVKYGVY